MSLQPSRASGTSAPASAKGCAVAKVTKHRQRTIQKILQQTVLTALSPIRCLQRLCIRDQTLLHFVQDHFLSTFGMKIPCILLTAATPAVSLFLGRRSHAIDWILVKSSKAPVVQNAQSKKPMHNKPRGSNLPASNPLIVHLSRLHLSALWG